MNQVVVGVGNPIMGDDGLGKRVVDTLADMDLDVEVGFAGTTAFLALELMQGADRAIVVDAIDVPDASPGSIHLYPLNSHPDPDTPEVLMHDFAFSEALSIGECAYPIPGAVLLIGMVPERVEVGLTLSETVANRLPALVDRIVAEVDRPVEPPTP